MDLNLYAILSVFLISMGLTLFGSYQLFKQVYAIGYKAGAQELFAEKNEIIEQAEEILQPDETDKDYINSVDSYLGNI